MKHAPFSPGDVIAASGSPVFTVCGPAGVGKSTFAREIIRLRGFKAHTFGTSDYCDIPRFKRTICALRASRGSGILMQLGHISGIGVIFDELERGGSVTRAVMRLVVDFASCADISNRVVVYVVRRLVDVNGLRRIMRSRELIELGPPTDTQLAHLAREIIVARDADSHTGGGGEDPQVLSWRELEDRDKRTMSSSIAALTRLANSDARVVRSEGIRDINISSSDTTIPELASNIISSVLRGDMTSAKRIAGVAPCAIANCHAGSVAQILRDPNDRILFARSFLASAEHGAAAFGKQRDDMATSYTEWLGPLATPLIRSHHRTPGRSLASTTRFNKLVAFSLPANIMIQKKLKL